MSLRSDPDKQRAWQERSARRYQEKLRNSPVKQQIKRKKLSYRKKNPGFWEQIQVRSGGRCEVGTPVCTGDGSTPHHLYGQAHGSLDYPSLVLACCAACNGYIEDHPLEAQASGFKLRPRQIEACFCDAPAIAFHTQSRRGRCKVHASPNDILLPGGMLKLSAGAK